MTDKNLMILHIPVSVRGIQYSIFSVEQCVITLAPNGMAVLLKGTSDCYYFKVTSYGSITAEELARHIGLSVVLTKER